MDKINKLLLQALKASLCNEKVDWDFEIQPQEWKDLFQQAYTHRILPMIYDAVYNCPAAKKVEASFWNPFKRNAVQQVMIQTMKTEEFLQLYQHLKKAGIRPLIVKGIICRELYPNPDCRSSGDEDMLIQPETFELCHRELLEYGMVVAGSGQDMQKSYEVPYGKQGSPIYIELHKYLFPPDSEAYGEFNQFFGNVHERAIEISVQGVSVLTMEYSSHFFYLICHAFKHFLHSGFGIRQICDIVLFANEHGKEIDWLKILEQCRTIHAEKFAAALLQIGEKYLTFSPDKACWPPEWRNISVEETALLEDLLSGGIYGSSNMSRKHSSNITLSVVGSQKKGDKSRYGVLRTAFPPIKYMETRFPYLRKFPFLVPVAWISRIVKYGKETGQGGENNAADSIKIGNRRIELMKQYGIIDNKKELK